MDTLPEYLFFYRHQETGFSRVTSTYLNQRRVLRQYYQLNNLPMAEGMALWTALVSLQKRNDALALRLTSLRYRLADHVHSVFACVPAVKKSVKWLLQSSGQAWHLLTTRKPAEESKTPRLAAATRTVAVRTGSGNAPAPHRG
jgi:hypothetical protein